MSNIRIDSRDLGRLALTVTNLRVDTLGPYLCDYSATVEFDGEGEICNVAVRGVELIDPKTMDAVAQLTEIVGTNWPLFDELRDAVRDSNTVRKEIAKQIRKAVAHG